MACDGQTDKDCIRCMPPKVMDFSKKLCIPKCPDYFFDDDSYCKPCDKSCKSCDGGTSSNCLSCFTYFEYLAESLQCTSCESESALADP